MKRFRTLRTIAAVAVAALLLAGCAAHRSSSVEPQQQAPVTHRISGYPNQLSPELAKDRSVAVVEGTVSSIGDPTWNTADRKKPSTEPQGDELPAIIYTPFRVKVDKAYKGVAGSYLDVKAFGGTLDGEAFAFDVGGYVPKAGERVVVFVSQNFTEKNGDKLAIPVSMYSIVGADAVNQFGGDQGNLPASALEQDLQH